MNSGMPMEHNPYLPTGPDRPGTVRYYSKVLSGLENKRSMMEPTWKDISELLLPRSGMLNDDEENENRRDYSSYNLINNTGTVALNTLKAGLMSGITNPARKWLRFVSPLQSNEDIKFKQWLQSVEREFFSVLSQSNFYPAIASMWEEVAAYGTAVIEVVPHDQDVVRFRKYTVGQYYLETNEFNMVNTIYIRKRMTTQQMVERYVRSWTSQEDRDRHFEMLSDDVKQCWRDGQLHETFEVIQAVFPNDTEMAPTIENVHENSVPKPGERRFKRVEFQMKSGSAKNNADDEPLMVRYTEDFPFIIARWNTNADDVYGKGPGWDVRGDIRELQCMEIRLGEALDKMTNPAVVASPSLNGRVDIDAGGITYAEAGGDAVTVLNPMTPQVHEYMQGMAFVERRIEKGLHSDLFRTITQLDKARTTATEIDQRVHEKLLGLSPVMENFDKEALQPLANLVYKELLRSGRLPMPPRSKGNSPLKVEYLNIVSVAQRYSSVESVMDYLSWIKQYVPDADYSSLFDRLNMAAISALLPEAMDVPQSMVLSDKELQEVTEAREKEMANMKNMQAGGMAADAMQKLGGVTGTDGKPFTQNVAENMAEQS